MAETDSPEEAISESLRLVMKAKELLATPNHEGFALLVDHLFMRRVSVEHKTARALYDFCVANFPNCLTLMHLKVYRYSSDDIVRFRSIYHLSETLTDLRNRRIVLSLVALREIKPLLISCLKMRKAKKFDSEFLRIIVSFVAFDVAMFDNGRWDELGDCILSLANSDLLRAFHVFLDLPPVYGYFIDRFLHKFLEGVHKILLHPEKDRVEDWTLALQTAVKLGIQLLDSETRLDLSREILETVVKSSDELVSIGMMEEFLQRGLRHLTEFLSKDSSLCKWSAKQCGFVAELAFRIAGIGKHTEEAAKKMYEMVSKLEKYEHNPTFKLSPSRVENHDPGLYYVLKQSSAHELLSLFASTEADDKTREMAIRRLHDLLCDHTSGEMELDVSEIEKLQPLLILCLKEEGKNENTVRILGQVVFHVALETFSYGQDPWFDLWDYMASESKFTKAVYIFQCLTMRFDVKDFVVSALNNLLPEMNKGLDPPAELLVDNSSWVLTFTGAFCAAIRLIDIKSYAGFVKEVALKMIESVKTLVERGMEVGLVRRAFRDLESIVKKQMEWYDTCEYRFLKGLIRRLYAIKGMRMESMMVLWRINETLERSMAKMVKELPGNELNWLNQPET